jgi:hypothetical protein
MLSNLKKTYIAISFCLISALFAEIITRGNGGSGYILRFAVTDPDTYNDSVAKGALHAPSNFEPVNVEPEEAMKLCKEFYFYVDESLRIYHELRPKLKVVKGGMERLLPANLIELPLRKDLPKLEQALLKKMFTAFKKKDWSLLCSKEKMRFGIIVSEIEPRYAFSAANYPQDASLAINPFQWKESPYLDDKLCSKMLSLRAAKTAVKDKREWCSQRFKLAIAFHEIVTLFWTNKEESNQYFDSALFVRNPEFLGAELNLGNFP